MHTNDERHNMSKKSDIPTKQEGNNTTSDDHGKHTKASSSSTWSKLKDPRIVRVSRAFGGKDRHSKVCTIRGLRDRRVRLSVPTAIQLYDLQDKLGLNQPSKVIDWLLNVAKNEIDELPPLPMPVPGNFGLNPQSMLTFSHEFGASQSNSVDNWEGSSGFLRSSFWNPDAIWRAKSKEVAGDHDTISGKQNWAKRDEKEREEENEGHDGGDAQVPFNNFLPGFLNNVMPYGSYYHLEPTNFPFSNSGSHVSSQSEDVCNFNAVLLPPTLSLSSGSQNFFPSQVSNFQMLSSSSSQGVLSSNSLAPPLYSSVSQSMRPLHFSMAPKLLPQNNSSGSHHPDKDQEFPPK